jgi:hypothetical protein
MKCHVFKEPAMVMACKAAPDGFMGMLLHLSPKEEHSSLGPEFLFTPPIS